MQAPRFLALATIALAAAAAGCGYRIRGDDFPPANAASGASPTLSPAFFPDLLKVRLDCEARGGELLARIDVANLGGVTASTFDTRVDVSGKHVSTRTIRPLASGATVRIGFFFTGSDSVPAAPGQMFMVSWSIDDPLAHPWFGEVLEYDEGNNTGIAPCTVQ